MALVLDTTHHVLKLEIILLGDSHLKMLIKMQTFRLIIGLQIFLLWMTHPSPRCSSAEGVQYCINPHSAHPPQ